MKRVNEMARQKMLAAKSLGKDEMIAKITPA